MPQFRIRECRVYELVAPDMNAAKAEYRANGPALDIDADWADMGVAECTIQRIDFPMGEKEALL